MGIEPMYRASQSPGVRRERPAQGVRGMRWRAMTGTVWEQRTSDRVESLVDIVAV